MQDILNMIGAFGTVAMGFLGLLFPRQASKLVGLTANSKAGQSEFRATYGGLWVPLGLIPIISDAALAYAIAGLCWLGAAGGRVLSIFLDDALDRKNIGAVFFELGFAALLLVGAPFATLLLIGS
ncbi:MAG: DUF4345 family protein [Aquisalinus sp.]|nr:DUF4345 family protein [Aquisalinus sp.]